jgi:hypothetical protein
MPTRFLSQHFLSCSSARHLSLHFLADQVFITLMCRQSPCLHGAHKLRCMVAHPGVQPFEYISFVALTLRCNMNNVRVRVSLSARHKFPLRNAIIESQQQ